MEKTEEIKEVRGKGIGGKMDDGESIEEGNRRTWKGEAKGRFGEELGGQREEETRGQREDE